MFSSSLLLPLPSPSGRCLPQPRPLLLVLLLLQLTRLASSPFQVCMQVSEAARAEFMLAGCTTHRRSPCTSLALPQVAPFRTRSYLVEQPSLPKCKCNF